MDGPQAALAKLRADGAAPLVLDGFARRLARLQDAEAGLLPGARLQPIGDPPALEDLPAPSAAETRAALDRIVLVRLNGGLGTSMGLTAPKTTIEVKPGVSFLDVIGRQAARAGVPVLLMNTPATRAAGPGFDDFLQSREPKLRADTHGPVDWPGDPALEWCPPGHGDVYPSLVASGALERLLEQGRRWAFIANADNLGAVVDARIAAWVVREKLPFAMEVVRGAAADRKGGHLATLDGRLVLRETAQVPEGDASFGDVEHWRWYNTNDLWVDLEAVRALLAPGGDGLDLPLIVNRKTVDPRDPDSPAVLQLETAMGAAVGAIAGARTLAVPRTRFAPVKTTDDLLVLRSDGWALDDDGRLTAAYAGAPPVVTLPAPYRTLSGFEERFPAGPPSLRGCRSLTVRGDVTFGAGVVVEGDVVLEGDQAVPDGTVLRG